VKPGKKVLDIHREIYPASTSSVFEHAKMELKFLEISRPDLQEKGKYHWRVRANENLQKGGGDYTIEVFETKDPDGNDPWWALLTLIVVMIAIWYTFTH
jgi:hypothetical protein